MLGAFVSFWSNIGFIFSLFGSIVFGIYAMCKFGVCLLALSEEKFSRAKRYFIFGAILAFITSFLSVSTYWLNFHYNV